MVRAAGQHGSRCPRRDFRARSGPAATFVVCAIENVRIVRNNWLNGFGIRMRPGWRLYNVSGLDAVELHLKNDDIRRIGTGDPKGLAAALKS